MALDAPGTSDSALFFYNAGVPKWALYNEGATGTLRINSSLFLDTAGRLSLGNKQVTPTTDLYVRYANKTPASDTYNQMIVTANGQQADFGGSLAFGGLADGISDASIKAFAGIAGRKENSTADNTAGYLALSVRANGGTALSEALRINSTGNVGIGTTNPRRKLSITVGEASVASQYDSDEGQAIIIGPTTQNTSGSLNIQSNSEAAADTGGSIAFGGRLVPGNAVGVTYAGVFGGKENSSSGNYLGYLAFNTRNIVGVGERMRINSSGNVGIGTTAPDLRTHVLGPSGFPATSGTAQNGALRLQGAGGGAVLDIGVDSAGYRHSWLQASTNYDLSFNQKLLLNPNGGGVSIGTTSPNGQVLETFRNSASTTQYATGSVVSISNLDPTPNNWSELWFAGANNSVDAAISAKFVNHSTHETNLYLTTRDGGGSLANRVSILASGNVGIGTETPAAKLHVAGNITVDGSLSARYQDVAEWVRARDVLAPGTVVVIGATGPDIVEASHEAYDTAVAGVVSPQPGIVLGEPGADKVLVAQSGRVRVKVDASYGAVRAGDLLVTSQTPGVAMRSEPITMGGRSMHQPGTLLGKALEPLASGQGEILVLLTLQ